MASLDIYIYPNLPTDDTYAQAIQTGIEAAFDHIKNNAVNYDNDTATTSTMSLDHPRCSTSSTLKFHDCIKEHVNNNYPNVDGCHLGVTISDNVVGAASSGEGFGQNEDSFIEARAAVVGQAWSQLRTNQAIAIQEVLHTAVDFRVCKPWNTREEDLAHEHDLGGVNSNGETHPMTTTYEGLHDSHGKCAGNAQENNSTLLPSNCTIRAIEATIRSNFNSTPNDERPWARAKQLKGFHQVWEDFVTDYKYEYPVVIMGPLSKNGSDPAFTRLKNISQDNTKFQYRLQEWSNQQQIHYFEDAGLVVLNDGKIRDDSGLELEAGMVSKVDENWKQVVFDDKFAPLTTPVVVTQPMTFNGSEGIVTRVKNTSDTSFSVRLQEQESKGPHKFEKVGYIAGRTGARKIDGHPYEANDGILVGDNWTKIDFIESYTNPVFVADMQTFNDSDTCNIRYKNLSGSGVEVQLQEEQSSDDETDHNSEKIGYFVFEEGAVP